jgi:hypothetical protein
MLMLLVKTGRIGVEPGLTGTCDVLLYGMVNRVGRR